MDDTDAPQSPGAKCVLGIDVGRKNMAMCLIRPGADPLGASDKILRWTILEIQPTAEGLIRGLDESGVAGIPEDYDVAIERQPLKNPTMKRLEHYLEMYFANLGKSSTVIDAKHKLAFAGRTPWWPQRDIPSWTYPERKKLSIETVANMLGATGLADEAFSADFGKSKKKDDLADCLLHAMAFAHGLRGRIRPSTGYKRIKPTKPSDAQVKSARYSQSGLKYLARGILDSEDLFLEGAEGIRGFRESCVRHFGSMEAAYVRLT